MHVAYLEARQDKLCWKVNSKLPANCKVRSTEIERETVRERERNRQSEQEAASAIVTWKIASHLKSGRVTKFLINETFVDTSLWLPLPLPRLSSLYSILFPLFLAVALTTGNRSTQKTNAKIGRKRLKQAANILSLFPRVLPLLPSLLPLRFSIVVTYILLGFVFCNVSMFRAVFFPSVQWERAREKGKEREAEK